MRKLAIALMLVLSCAAISAVAQSGSLFLGGLSDAEEAAGGGTLLFARREVPLFGYYFWVNGRLIEIELRGRKVEKKREIKEIGDKGPVSPKLIDALTVRTKTKLPNARYVEIALERTKGTEVLSYSLNVVNDNIYVDIKTDGGSVKLDMTDGKVVR